MDPTSRPGYGPARVHPGEDWISQIHVDLAGLWERAAFRVIEAYDVVVGPRWAIELDIQPYTEIWLIRSGQCKLRVGDHEALAGAGQIAVLLPGTPRSSANGGPGPLSLVGFGCDLLLFDGVDLLEQLDLPLVIGEPSAAMRTAIEKVVAASRGNPTDRVFRTRAWAEFALAEILATTPGVPFDRASNPSLSAMRLEVSRALRFISEHYGDPDLDLRALAAAVHVSPQHLSRRFRDSLGVAPMTYLRRHRLSRARDQVLTTDVSMTTIMQDVGLRSPAHFSRSFKRQFGVSPRTLREIDRGLRPVADRAGQAATQRPAPLV